MGIWIRSQGGEALKEVQSIRILNVGGTRIGSFNMSGTYELGEYESKEESLAVLDEIQNLLQPRMILKSSEPCAPGDITPIWELKPAKIIHLPGNTGVYQMPPKGFLKEKAAAKASDQEC